MGLGLRMIWLWMGLGVGMGLAQVTGGWDLLTGGRTERPQCVDIPANLSLCHNIDYRRMRLPNLLGQETLAEVGSQAGAWLPLLRLSCHPDAQLFLCSLFAPVCLEREIRPCRSLCEAVKRGCEPRMLQYGFPWPPIFHCQRFPPENDMCIKPRTSYIKEVGKQCSACSGVATYENILDHFCRSEVVGKVKSAGLESNRLLSRRGRLLKPLGDSAGANLFQGRSIFFQADRSPCPCQLKRTRRYLLTANRNERGELVASLILPWEKSRQFKKAIRMFRKLNCRTLGTVIRERARRNYSASPPRGYRTTRTYTSPPF